MIHVPISITSNPDNSGTVEPLKISIPFKQGALLSVNQLKLINDALQFLPFQHNTLAKWPDGSIKWLLINFYYKKTNINNTAEQLVLTDKSNSQAYPIASTLLANLNITINENANEYIINTGETIFSLNAKILGIFSPRTNENKLPQTDNHFDSHDKSIELKDHQGVSYYPHISQLKVKKHSSDTLFLESTLTASGSFVNHQNKHLLNFTADITFFAGSANTQWSFTIHNPNAMQHHGGKWDLGNENSVFFNSLNAIVFTHEKGNIKYRINSEHSWQDISQQNISVHQVSSGGNNWQSRNHLDYTGHVNTPFNGYSLTVNNKKEKVAGRAQPKLSFQSTTTSISVEIENFWQNFPKKISAHDNEIQLGIFPEQDTGLFELQPGEKKTHVFNINYGVHNSQSNFTFNQKSTHLSICADYIAQTKAIPFFTAKAHEQPLEAIIKQGLSGSNNFFEKREVIDEFGWRNFGDLYADHEALEYKGEGELISHYNNQYDPLYGFLRQYLATNEPKWLELANDLAAHIKDIDIYHTQKDRDEYNGGLFWHTDHYLSAETASHRTYSAKQSANAYQDHAGGGGPGGQHCYTSGLMLHYFLTGDNSSKEAALTLSKWITHVYEGSQTFTDFLLAIKNKNRIDLKNIFTGKYPLDRGTGHYIIALIDAFELTGKQHYLDQASIVIKNTVHPDDNIDERDLLNVEQCWFYTVFFQAVYRFLLCKETNQQFDSAFDFARASLLHYGRWMVIHEAPYLDKPEILEYPNHTWAAQDIRKANVLFFAARFAHCENEQQRFITKAESLYQYVTSELATEPTSDTSRILSILMQNYGIKGFCLSTTKPTNLECATGFNQSNKSSKQNLLDALKQTLNKTSVNKELDWLRKRVTKVDNLLTKLGK